MRFLCSMNIDGQNTLACQENLKEIKGDINIFPLTHLPVIKDLVVDLSHAFQTNRIYRTLASNKFR